MQPSDIIKMLKPLAAEADVGDPHWINGADDCDTYCENCIEAALSKAQAEADNADDVSSQGSCGQEYDSDRLRTCETCDRLVQYTLTDYGVESELQHFAQSPPTWPPASRDAYEILRIFEDIDTADWTGENGPEAKKLAEVLVAAQKAAT